MAPNPTRLDLGFVGPIERPIYGFESDREFPSPNAPAGVPKPKVTTETQRECHKISGTGTGTAEAFGGIRRHSAAVADPPRRPLGPFFTSIRTLKRIAIREKCTLS